MTEISGRDYEVGGAVIHPRNKYMVDFLKLLGNSRSFDSDSFFLQFTLTASISLCDAEPHINKHIVFWCKPLLCLCADHILTYQQKHINQNIQELCD